MNNVFEYLKWRDDIPLYNITEVDALIFNMLAYIPFEKLFRNTNDLSIQNAFFMCEHLGIKLHDNEYQLFKILSTSKRYQNLIIKNVVSKLDFQKEEQFMAMTIVLPNNCLYIAYRGTTSDLIGFKEDFSMSYMTTFAQLDALSYLNEANLTKKIYLGGHSKGGNLAMYALIHANRLIKSRIVKVFNFDGPGFLNLPEEYFKVKDKIISYLPSDSIVGRLMNLESEVIVIDSFSRGLKQHNLYTWLINKDKFVTSKLTKNSDKIKKVMDEFLIKFSSLERQKIINDIFDILNDLGITKVTDINVSKLKDIIMSYHSISQEGRDILLKIIKYLYEVAFDNSTS